MNETPFPIPVRVFQRFRLWWRNMGMTRKLTFSLALAAVISGLATVGTMTGSSPLALDPKTVLILLYLDVILLLLLGLVVARQLVKVWAERRRGLAGSRMHIRLVLLFSLVAVTPAIVVAVFAGLFLNFGIQAWFSERVRTALEASHVVANAYLHEHQQNIRADAFAMAADLNREAPVLARNQWRFAQVLSAQAAFRSLPEAWVVDGNGRARVRSQLSLALDFDLVSAANLEQARLGEIVVLINEQDDRVRALVKLDRYVDSFLLVGRFVEPRVMNHIERTKSAVAQYKSLEKRRKSTQITFVMIFMVVALLLLLASVWLGLTLATQLVRPISNLISAAERVSDGDLTARVDTDVSSDEIGILNRAFNRMTGQLEGQRRGLVEANRQLDERRRFTETVLTGVSAGVIGLDGQGRIHLPNRSASELLAIDLLAAVGKGLVDVVPEMAELVKGARSRPERLQQSEIKLMRQGRQHTLLVRIAAERMGSDIIGYVITFDDITELLSAQRTAAWADIARRIAHEIKNPLTPIQLSAERLKRKYLKEIKTEPEVFSTCTETIVRQVEDIGRMVDEFSAFARMPQPSLKAENLSEICRHAAFLERNRHPEVEFSLDLPETDSALRCDGRQVGQALTNLLKNATESILARDPPTDGEALHKGRVRIAVEDEKTQGSRRVAIVVEDNGRGLPAERRDLLTEPYVTSHDKGTGLGLAIVKKIMEDHNGDLVLEDRDEGGARISLVFRRPAEDDQGAEGDGGEKDAMKIATGILAHGS